MDFRAWRRRIREYDEITNVGPIVRRYFVIGAFDGALTVLGIIIGAVGAGATEAHKPLILSASVGAAKIKGRSEEHTSELQSQSNLVCRLLLEKKKKRKNMNYERIDSS